MKEPIFSRIEAVAYRATTYDTPLWVFPNRLDGRWNRPERKDIVQYCCLDPAAPLAEVVRHENLDAGDAPEVRFDLWQLRISEGSVINLSTPDLARRAGIDWADLTSDSWAACQAIGGWAKSLGARGIVAPSAALPGSSNLMLLGPRSELAWDRDSVLSIQVPARAVIHGAPQTDLIRATRKEGDPYPSGVGITPIDHLFQS